MKLKLIAAVLLFIVLGLFAYSFLLPRKKVQEELLPYTLLSEKPVLSGDIVKNPDFIYKSNGWLSTEHVPEGQPIFIDSTEFGWESDGYYDNRTIDGRSGVIVIHPLSVEEGRYIEQEVYLSSEKEYELDVGLANVAGKIEYAATTGCDDVGFKIIVTDLSTGTSKIIFDEIVDSGEGWKDFSIHLGYEYSGKAIGIRIESYGGGPCGEMEEEWAGLDYIDIVEK